LVQWYGCHGPSFRKRQGTLTTRGQPEAIIEKPQHAAILLGQGKKIAEIVRTLGITAVTHYRWHQEYGRMV